MSMDFLDYIPIRLDKSEKTVQVYKSPNKTSYDSLSLFAGHQFSGKSMLSTLIRAIEWMKSPLHQEFYYERSNYPFLSHENKEVSAFLSHIGEIREEIAKAVTREYCPDEQSEECYKEIVELSHSISKSMKKHETAHQYAPVQTNTQYIETETEEQSDDTQKLSIKEILKNSISTLKNNLSKKDRRVNNGRKAETHLCDGLKDEVVLNIMRQCHERIFGCKIEDSPKLLMFLSCFIDALFAYLNNPYDTCIGRIAYWHRMLECAIGKLVNCGLRALQKSIVWLMSELNIPKGASIWESRAKEKHDRWINLSQDLESMIGELVPVMVKPD